MTSGGMNRTLVQGIVLKVGFPLLIALLTLAAGNVGGMRAGDALQLAAIVGFAVALILFVVDTEIRLSAVGERVTAGFAQIGRLAELSAKIERSSLGPALLAEFLETASQVDGRVNPLLQRVVRQEIERVTAFAHQLQVGGEIAYDGEDRDWLLGLTQEAQASIDAISLSTVDAGVLGLDGGLWTSDLGIRYLDDQRKAIARKVRIRRIFVFEAETLAQDESFQRVARMQRNAGVQVRMLDQKLIPDYLQSTIFDFIIFDGAVSYETTAGTPVTADQPRPGTLRTRLAPEPNRVRDLELRFEQLWHVADPDRPIDDE
jgi:hypothetical protein